MKSEKEFQATEQEIKLIKLIREIGYGEVHIIVKESRPIRIEQIQKSIKLE